MTEHDCKHEKEIADLMDYRLVSIESLSSLKTSNKIIIGILMLILTAVVFPMFVEKKAAKDHGHEHDYFSADYSMTGDSTDERAN